MTCNACKGMILYTLSSHPLQNLKSMIHQRLTILMLSDESAYCRSGDTSPSSQAPFAPPADAGNRSRPSAAAHHYKGLCTYLVNLAAARRCHCPSALEVQSAARHHHDFSSETQSGEKVAKICSAFQTIFNTAFFLQRLRSSNPPHYQNAESWAAQHLPQTSRLSR